jgi:glutamate synthase domain-containing protein 1
MSARHGTNADFLFLFPRHIRHNSRMTTHASGVIAAIPWDLLAEDLPDAFSATRAPRALGTFFLPRSRAREMTAVVEQTLRSTGWTSVEWRSVPVCFERFDRARRQSMPAIMQIAAIAETGIGKPGRALERARVYMETHAARHQARGFAVVSLSTSTVIYKGLLAPDELPVFYPDLRSPGFGKPLAVLHRKLSTTADPLWALAPPLHTLAHNGELRQETSSLW